MTKLFVYGVNSRCPKDLLEDEFGRCGKVEDIYITGKGKCFSTLGYEFSYKIFLIFTGKYLVWLNLLLIKHIHFAGFCALPLVAAYEINL